MPHRMSQSQATAVLLAATLLVGTVANLPSTLAEQAAAAAARPFFAGCPENLAGSPWEDDIERKQSQWFFKPKTLKERTFEITYSSLADGNATRCDPVLGPVVVSRWAGLGRGMITLAPRGPAGSKHRIDLSPLKKGVQYYMVDTFQDAWQRYRGYRAITLQ